MLRHQCRCRRRGCFRHLLQPRWGAYQSYVGQFTISSDGVHQLSFYSVDSAGQETPHGRLMQAPGSFKVAGAGNEPTNPNTPDIVITEDGSGGFLVQLRADRLGMGNGRVYTLTATATDNAGNSATATSTCSVPHDQGH